MCSWWWRWCCCCCCLFPFRFLVLLLHSWREKKEKWERDIGQCLLLMDAVLASQPARLTFHLSKIDQSMRQWSEGRDDDGQAKQTRREKSSCRQSWPRVKSDELMLLLLATHFPFPPFFCRHYYLGSTSFFLFPSASAKRRGHLKCKTAAPFSRDFFLSFVALCCCLMSYVIFACRAPFREMEKEKE